MNNYKQQLLELLNQKDFLNKETVTNLFRNKKIIIYGAGSGSVTFSVFVLKKYGLFAHVVLDKKYKEKDTYLGAPAYSPDTYVPTQEEKENAIVVVTVGKKELHDEIRKQLIDAGFKNIVMAHDIYEYHLLFEPNELNEKGFDYYLDNKQHILDCFDILADEESQKVYLAVVKTHLTRSIDFIPSHPLQEQYFPKDILHKGYKRFVNCGAYVGDTILQAYDLFGEADAVACFEPDLENFKLLSKNLDKKQIAKNIAVFPCGVFNDDVQLFFNANNKVNSSISTSGDSIIQCVTIDHAIPQFNPTFISMDIEGAELEALKGAVSIISEYKPELAICVYHAPNHIWDIPLYLNNLRLGYKFYLRNYTSFISETVLYATV